MDIFNIFIPRWGFPPTPAASHLIQMMQGGWQPAMDCQDAPANLRRRGDDSRVSCNFLKNASAGSLGFKNHWLPVLSILTWECNAPDRVDMDMMGISPGVVLTISRFFSECNTPKTHQRRKTMAVTFQVPVTRTAWLFDGCSRYQMLQSFQ